VKALRPWNHSNKSARQALYERIYPSHQDFSCQPGAGPAVYLKMGKWPAGSQRL
jgi:hypothetical protein